MNHSVMFIVSSDPRSSARPAEAIRIAAGVGTWKMVDVRVYLRGAAVLALSEVPDELVDADNYSRYLPIIGEFGQAVYVQKGSPFLTLVGQPALPFQELADHELATLMAHTHYAAHF